MIREWILVSLDITANDFGGTNHHMALNQQVTGFLEMSMMVPAVRES